MPVVQNFSLACPSHRHLSDAVLEQHLRPCSRSVLLPLWKCSVVDTLCWILCFGMSSLETRSNSHTLRKEHWATVAANSDSAVLQDEWHTLEWQELCFQGWDLHTFKTSATNMMLSWMTQARLLTPCTQPLVPAAPKLRCQLTKTSCCPRGCWLTSHPLF